MRAFLTYLDIYRNKRVFNADVELMPKDIPPVVPNSSIGNNDVVDFFAGKNVYHEVISTNGGYSYKALIHTKDVFSEKELASEIQRGLTELGYTYTKFAVNKVKNQKGNGVYNIRGDYEVVIQMS